MHWARKVRKSLCTIGRRDVRRAARAYGADRPISVVGLFGAEVGPKTRPQLRLQRAGRVFGCPLRLFKRTESARGWAEGA
jgi:hypothetical protein